MSYVLWGSGLLVGVGVVWVIYLAIVLAWGEQQTLGVAYYGRTPEERQRFKRALRRHARLTIPPLRLFARFSRFDFGGAAFRVDGIAGPKGTCTEESFREGMAYEPGADDVFVVTQMKCGTTWMQHLVYQILCRGRGDIVESGRTLYALSPWLESTKSVAVADAPLLGAGPAKRIIKTHLPAGHCPRDDDARYIYVARHPVACFASCVDFVAANLGPFRPDLDTIEAWYCSDGMWWGDWASHVAGWWTRRREQRNVLFVTFEEMKADLPAVVRSVARFLGVDPLDDEEMASVCEKCGFDYMRTNEGAFEMHPPHLLAVDAELFVSGSADRHLDVPADTRERVRAWCAERLEPSGFPFGRFGSEGARR